MTPEEVAADEAEHRETLESVRNNSRRRTLASDMLNPKPLPKRMRLGRMARPFTSQEEACSEMTKTRSTKWCQRSGRRGITGDEFRSMMEA